MNFSGWEEYIRELSSSAGIIFLYFLLLLSFQLCNVVIIPLGPSIFLMLFSYTKLLKATVNRSKGNKTEVSKSDLMQKSAYCRVSGMQYCDVNNTNVQTFILRESLINYNV
jgi:hypothetical protein